MTSPDRRGYDRAIRDVVSALRAEERARIIASPADLVESRFGSSPETPEERVGGDELFSAEQVADAIHEVINECLRDSRTPPLRSLADRLWLGLIPPAVEADLDRNLDVPQGADRALRAAALLRRVVEADDAYTPTNPAAGDEFHAAMEAAANFLAAIEAQRESK